ncbi:mechanosensitive ion channel family protein [Desertibacillus haloalkaliphilus]|uniref:mechanosensitive ion channel family protein n=1 Tax=Desertibacillus haloalkaliphilus TaxID=1328930 RepID=UPI001C271BDE|nr:mechanosensitive ion channel family protein [Desertibacillus haloalkaliphilus]MBU8906787.1 mechanosensitive ion channel family protein [Desertibacillus haloalkaliphilus]
MDYTWFEDYLLAIPWFDIGIALGIFILFLVFRKIFTRYIFKLIIKLSRKAPTDVFTNVLLAFEKPLRVFFVFVGIYLSLLYLPLSAETMVGITKLYRTIIILCIGWGLYNFASESSSFFAKVGAKLDLDGDSMLIPFLSKFSRFLIVALFLSIIAGEWGYDVNGFVAGLGLGGLAFALAAQDTIGNFFGGIIIITEKPFAKGDWIHTPSVEGTVEDITFRSTKIRTFADAVVTVPNSTLANEAITNWTQMGKRRITFHLGVMYSTPKEKVEACVHKIEEMLRGRDDIDQEVIFVTFDKFNDSSLDLFLYFFTKTTNWGEYLAVKEAVNLEIMGILEKEGVSVAFPSRSLYVEKGFDLEALTAEAEKESN